jgi:iron complex outermembrane receptor protein
MSSMNPRPQRAAIPLRVTRLAFAVASAVAATAQAQTAQQLERVVVTADPLERDDLNTLRAVNVLRGDALRDKEATNLGASLGRESGVQSSAYGPGAGRPIIRGMDSARVRVTESGLGVADVSGVSPDHRVSADVLNSGQVEVLRGPATLLYGSGAIGGLVNIVSDRVPRRRPSDFGATLNLRGSTAEREALGAVGLDGPIAAQGAWRLEGFKQKTKNYELAAPLRDETGTVIANDRLPNSETDTQSVSLGGAWIGAHTRIGAAAQRYESDYGIPNPEEPVTIDLKRSRFELQADHSAAFGPFSGLRSRFGLTDYEHTEFDPSGEPGAIFTHKGGEGRVELSVPALAGFRTVVGTQLQQGETRGAGEGELPKTDATSLALFAVGERQFGAMRVDMGARAESERYKVKEDYESGARARNRSFSLFTASGGTAWALSPALELGATLTLSQRAPAVEELYYFGAHPATFAFEIGDPNLNKERSTHLELALRHQAGAVRAKANLFFNRVRDYIYGAFDGSTTDILDENGNVEETLSNLFYRQADARIRGAEAELAFGDKLGLHGRVWGDTTRGSLTSGEFDGGNLPRFAPSRLGVDFGWKAETWSANAAVTRVFKQDKTSNFDLRDGTPEAATDGYTTLDAGVSYRLRAGEVPVTLYLLGRNLTDEDIRIHTSFLKNFAPPPGRSIFFGVRASL